MSRPPDRWPIMRAALAEAARTARTVPRRLVPSFGRAPAALLFAPQDLRVADPAIADDLAAGIYVFGDRTVRLGAGSPFDEVPPSMPWAYELYGFGWLRHLRAAETPEAGQLARRLVADAIGRGRDLAPGLLAPAVTARRVTSLLAHSPMLLEATDQSRYRGFLRLVGQDVAALLVTMRSGANPADRLSAAMAACFAGLACDGFERVFRAANRTLAAELDAQIWDDGGHIGRNPGMLVTLLLDLLPLRLLYETRGVEVPDTIGRAIGRMMPALRFFRHGSGDLALFNGMGRTPMADLATVLSQDVDRLPVRPHAAASGYDRLEAGGTCVLIETGTAPPLAASGAAHGGCLSLELSSGLDRIVVNCGAPPHAGPLREAARRTAAHSCLVLDDASSTSALGPDEAGWAESYLYRHLGPVLVAAPRTVTAERRETPEGDLLVSAQHDGYRATYGALHARRLVLTADGRQLVGEDTLRFPDGDDHRAVRGLLRFHLHPDILAAIEGQSVVLTLPHGEIWRFASPGATSRIEPSLFMAVSEGRRPTSQIVVDVPRGPNGSPSVRWSFRRE